jgi:hypothetical protein
MGGICQAELPPNVVSNPNLVKIGIHLNILSKQLIPSTEEFQPVRLPNREISDCQVACIHTAKKQPHGGAGRGACEKSEVVVCQPRSVCAKFGMDRGNGGGDKSRAKSVT